MDKVKAFLLTTKQAEEFFRRVEFKEAITEEERINILRTMFCEGQVKVYLEAEGTREGFVNELKKSMNVIEIERAGEDE